MSTIECTIHLDEVECNGTIYKIPEKILTYTDEWFWIYLGIYVGLVLVAGLMSGLTMGLLSLDLMTLKVLRDGGTPKEKKHAERILPIVEKHHLLLVTLLLANAAAVEAMPIFLDRISDPIIAVCVSVSAVLIFGELVYLLMAIFFIISWPLSKVLDCVLGEDHTTFYRRAQLKVLVDLHGPNSVPNLATQDSVEENADHLTIDEVLIIKGALDMKNKTVKDAMLPIDDVYMLRADAVLDKKTMCSILQQAHSRVPVYEDNRQNILGVIIVKNLILLDPDDAVPIRKLLKSPAARNVIYVDDNMALFDILNLFQTGKGHLAFVRKGKDVPPVDFTTGNENLNDSDTALLIDHTEETMDGFNGVIGIITLEDVIEELIQEEIIDETDIYIDIHQRIQVARAKRARMEHKSMMKSYSQPVIKKPPSLNRHLSGSLPEDSHVTSIQEVDETEDTDPLLPDQVVFT
ncbi:hypothetical protein KUTeg_006621 [Tegillarca granosa]|uniref:CNNM transmembrane domain-containing protein n=1 Tax=Tegillarca granosa TaxID=220873 RepID=A0ABQ9FE26_TEGGR|nr:hypothetical protein KUTeg_006621 [Tegillarca granosa]